MKALGLQFFKFLCVGFVCIVLNLLALYCLTDFLGMHYLLSCTIAVFFVNYIGFRLNREITFRESGVDISPEGFFQFIKYNVVSVVSFFLVIAEMYILVDILGFWYIHANIIAGVFMAFFNFFMHKKITYANVYFSGIFNKIK